MDERVSSVRERPESEPQLPELRDLGGEVVSSLEQAREANSAIDRVRARIVAGEASRLRKQRRIRPAAVVAGFALAASIALAVGLGAARSAHTDQTATNTKPAPAALTFSVNDKNGATGSFISATQSTPVKFSDGSELKLAPSARVRVTEVADNGARVLVENGSMHVSVVHREQTRWAIEAGPYVVHVTGTKFNVAWDAAKNGLVVKMEEGSVVVDGCGLGQPVKNQEELTVSCGASLGQPATSTLELPASASASASAPPVAPSAKPKAVDPTRGIVSLSKSGQHAEAIAAAEENGYDATCGALSGPELLLLADSARYVRRFELATAALNATRNRFPGTDSAATAAFELGRIAMDIQRDYVTAGNDFDTYLAERPDGAVAREAVGRDIEARHRAGDDTTAANLATTYLARWPDGPHSALAKKITGGTK